jgi:two-component system chemotaxis sensor kinase CheA
MEDRPIDKAELQEIISQFITESVELVDMAVGDLVSLEKEPSGQAINSVFRAVHTIKGTSGFLGFEKLSSLAHRSEDVLGRLRKGELRLSPDIITTLLKTLDVMRLLVEDINCEGKEARNIAGLLAELQTIVPGVDRDDIITVPHGLKQDTADSLSDGLETIGTIEPEETSAGGLQESHGHSKIEQTVRVEVKKLDELMDLVGELVLGKNRLMLLNTLLKDDGGEDPAAGYPHAGGPLMDSLAEVTNYIEMITSELQTAVMRSRLVPIGKLFNKVPRLLRDLCSASGKKTELTIEGGDTELDKSFIETLHDPLTHIMRNSIDHGIETPEERVQAGKPPKGLISVKARTEGNQVVIEVLDDGRGIDVEAIKGKVAERGLLPRSQVDGVSIEEAVSFIFIPGFSTARVLSPVSGRGVGLDVVKTNIEKMNGHVYIESAKGKWTRLIIKLPLTLAIMKALLIGVGNELYAIPLSVVLEVVRLKQDLIKTVGGQEVLVLRDAIIPVITLSRVLSVAAEPEEEGSVIVCRGPDRPVGLRVRSIIGQEEVVIKSLGEFLKSVRWVAGATIRGDGRVALILDLAGIVADFFKQRVAA